MKFLTHKVTLQSSHPKFKKNVLDRGISMKFLISRISVQSSYPNFQKNICLAKNGTNFQFSNFSQKLQKTKMLISRKLC